MTSLFTEPATRFLLVSLSGVLSSSWQPSSITSGETSKFRTYPIIPFEQSLTHLRRTRAEKWDAMSSEERDAYLASNKDEGNKRYVTIEIQVFAQDMIADSLM